MVRPVRFAHESPRIFTMSSRVGARQFTSHATHSYILSSIAYPSALAAGGIPWHFGHRCGIFKLGSTVIILACAHSCQLTLIKFDHTIDFGGRALTFRMVRRRRFAARTLRAITLPKRWVLTPGTSYIYVLMTGLFIGSTPIAYRCLQLPRLLMQVIQSYLLPFLSPSFTGSTSAEIL